MNWRTARGIVGSLSRNYSIVLQGPSGELIFLPLQEVVIWGLMIEALTQRSSYGCQMEAILPLPPIPQPFRKNLEECNLQALTYDRHSQRRTWQLSISTTNSSFLLFITEHSI